MHKKIIIIFSLAMLLAGCSSKNSRNSYYGYGDAEYEREIENPYSSGSGHSAGYEWAQRTGGNCTGNSASFNEGCEEYYSQLGE